MTRDRRVWRGFLIGCGWTFISLILHVSNYSFWGL